MARPVLYMKTPRSITVTYYSIIEKTAAASGRVGSSGRIYVPAEWVGKKVLVLLQEPINDNERTD